MVQLSPADIQALRDVVPAEASANRAEYEAMVWSIVNAAQANGRSVADEVASGRYFGYSNPSPGGLENRSNPTLQGWLTEIIPAVASGRTPDPTRGATHFEGTAFATPKWAAGMTPTTVGKTTFYAPGGQQVDRPNVSGPPMSDRTIAGYVASRGDPVSVVEGIGDRTSTRGMTPEALAILEGAQRAAAEAGLSQIVITAGRGGGHLSHSQGTEWDIKGINPDGSLWTPEQRAIVAQGARSSGADRFGLYNMENGLGKGTLHIGLSGPGRPAAVWGANGLVRGEASRAFSNDAERAFLASYRSGQPYAYAPVGRQSGAQRAAASMAAGTPRNVVMGPSAATRFPANIVPRDWAKFPPYMLASGRSYATGRAQSPAPAAAPVSRPGPTGPAPGAQVIPDWAQALAGKTGMEPGFRSVAAAQPGPSGGPRFDYITGMAPRPSMGLPGFMGRAFAPDTVAGKAMGALGRGLGNLGIQMPSAGQGGGLMGAFAGPGPSVPTTAYQAPGGTVWSWANPASNQGGGEFQGPTSFNSSGGGGLGAFLGSIFGGR